MSSSSSISRRNLLQKKSIQVLIENGTLTLAGVLATVKDALTSHHVYNELEDLLYSHAAGNDSGAEHTWLSVTESVESFLAFVARSSFEEREIQSLGEMLVSLPVGQYSSNFLLLTIKTYQRCSTILARVFHVESISDAQAASAFLKALNPRVRTKVDSLMHQHGYSRTTTGMLNWLRTETARIEISLGIDSEKLPQGYNERRTQFDNNRNTVRFNQISDTVPRNQQPRSNPYDHLQYAESMDYSGPPLTDSTSVNNHDPVDLRGGRNSESLAELKTFQRSDHSSTRPNYTQNKYPPRNQTYTPYRSQSPALRSPDPKNITDEIRQKWFRDGKCVNCGDASHKVGNCPLPKHDQNAISRVFLSELKRTNYAEDLFLNFMFCQTTPEDSEEPPDQEETETEHELFR